MKTLKKVSANITAVLSLFILTLSIIDLVNPSINMLDNMGGRVILIVYCVFALFTAIAYICDFFSKEIKENKNR